MKITYPHMGNLHLPLHTLFTSLKCEVIPPPPITNKTLKLGSKHSPEFACFPLKINVGNFIEALEQGADTIAMLGGAGPCRFGYYSEIEKKILESLGYKFDMIVVDPPSSGNFNNTRTGLKKLKGENNWKEIIHSLWLSYYKLNLLDQFEQLLAYIRPRSDRYKQINFLEEQFHQEILHYNTKSDLNKSFSSKKSDLYDLITSTKEPVKVALVGEIYMVAEHNVNMEIIKSLGEFGVQVERGVYISSWIRDNLLLGPIGLAKNKQEIRAAKPYIKRFVGGHGQESIGEAILKIEQGCRGIIHLFPFTCTPEIIAQGIMSKVSRDYNVPVMTLVLDEHSGTTGLQTRLEAFCDLL